MKNIMKIFSVIVVGAALAFASCTPDEGREPSPTVDGPAAHFDQGQFGSSVTIKEGDMTTDVTLYRDNVSTEAVTVPLTLTDPTGFFSVAQSVTIPANADKVSLPLNFDSGKFAPGTFYSVTIAISDDKVATPYGPSTLKISVGGLPIIWEDWAKGTFTSDFEILADGTLGQEENVILQKGRNIDRFRFQNLAFEGFSFTFNWNITDKETSIAPVGTSMTISGTPVIRQGTGVAYDAASSIYWLTDPAASSYDPETKEFIFHSNFYVFVDATMGGVGGFGWFDDFYEIKEFLQGDPWE